MAALTASTMGASTRVSSGVSARRPLGMPKVTRNVAMRAGDRPLWFPGNPAPAHLDGSLAGDYGFDPLSLGADSDNLRWFVQAELVHSRTAMAGVAGILFTGIGASVGLGYPQWYDAGKVSIENSPLSFGTLFFTQMLLCGWAEHKRLYDFKNPGSQGDGFFAGITGDFVAKENGYPGGKYFDFMGLAAGDEAKYANYKQAEIKNGRLAMIACVGFVSQFYATGKGPIENLVDHLADPYHVTFATNGVSVPTYGSWFGK